MNIILPEKNKSSIEDNFRDTTGQAEIIRLVNFKDLVPNSDNPYPITELEDLIDSILLYGVQQNLLVQKKGDKYLIIAGHRRYSAIKSIIENVDIYGEKQDLEQVYCKVIDEDEDNTLVKIRLHDTNLQARPLNKMNDNEKTEIVNEYIALIQEAKDKKLKIKGKEVKGKTRKILSNMLGVSERTAQKYINMANDVGGKVAPAEKKVKTTSDELRIIIKKLTKIEFEKSEEEKNLVKEIINLLNDCYE